MKQHEQLQQTIEQMQAAGLSNDQIQMFMGKLQAAAQAGPQASQPSQSDRVEIRQSEGNVPGVYVDSTQIAQDMFAEAFARGQDITRPQTHGLVGGPPRASGFVDQTMGNPNYTVAEPTVTTANGQGHTVIY